MGFSVIVIPKIMLFFNTQAKKILFLFLSVFFCWHLCNYRNARTQARTWYA